MRCRKAQVDAMHRGTDGQVFNAGNQLCYPAGDCWRGVVAWVAASGQRAAYKSLSSQVMHVVRQHFTLDLEELSFP